QVLEEVLLGDPVPSVRAAAAEALGNLGDVQSARALEQAAGDRFPLVRAAVARALRRCGDEGSAATLARLANDPRRRVRRAASGDAEPVAKR
ncbi:MAG: HEAT repeat domain-containing protein, partial [Anaerolineae bacterium]